MLISKELAEKYVRYRDRFLGGSDKVYAGIEGITTARGIHFPNGDPCSTEKERKYKKGEYVPFMVVAGDPERDVGTFMHVDFARVDGLEIDQIKFGDNTVYGQIAMVCFAAEYSVTLKTEPLHYALGIAKSLRRLGSHQKGFQENGKPPYGFIIRGDSCDDGSESENFCAYRQGVRNTKMTLAPSLDQYSAMLSCLSFAKTIIDQAAHDQQNTKLRSEFLDVVEERTKRISDYFLSTLYTIRWEENGKIVQPARGPSLHPAARPLAEISAKILTGDSKNYDSYLGNLGLSSILDINKLLRDSIKQGIDEFLVPALRNKFVQLAITTLGGGIWAGVAELLDAVSVVEAAFDKHVREPVRKDILAPILKQLNSWNGTISPKSVLNDLIAQFIFQQFATAVLLHPSDKLLFENAKLKIKLSDLLGVIGNVQIANSIPVNIKIPLVPVKPPWFDIFGKWNSPSWDISIASFDIDRKFIDQVEIAIPFSGILRKLVAAIPKQHEYLKLLVFNLLSASDSFRDVVPEASPEQIAFNHGNAWFMSLAHRLHGAKIDDSKVSNVLNILQTAPDDFPNSNNKNGWNQDFRWIRGMQSKTDPELYSGLDFMAPLMVAASHPTDAKLNNKVLTDALQKNTLEEIDMNLFRLPFQGPINGKTVFEPKLGGLVKNDKVVYVSVVFERPIGSGKVILVLPSLKGGTQEVEFRQDDHHAKLVAVPLSDQGIQIKSASSDAKGVIFVSPE